MVVEVRGSSPRKALTLPSRRALIGPPGRPVCAKRERKSAMHTWVPQSLTALKFMLWMHQSLCIEVFPHFQSRETIADVAHESTDVQRRRPAALHS